MVSMAVGYVTGHAVRERAYTGGEGNADPAEAQLFGLAVQCTLRGVVQGGQGGCHEIWRSARRAKGFGSHRRQELQAAHRTVLLPPTLLDLF